MDPVSPALAEAYHLLQQDLYRHLEEAEYLAEDDWYEEQADLGRMLLLELAAGVRSLLAAHQAGGTGECRTCAKAWPCQVTGAIHRLVRDPDNHFAQLLNKTD